MIISKTQLEIDVQNIERAIESTTLSLASSASILNYAYNALWDLPDDRLLNVLNYLGPQTVMSIFSAHNNTANSLNNSLEASGSNMRAINAPLKTLDIISGQFVIVYPPGGDPTEGE